MTRIECGKHKPVEVSDKDFERTMDALLAEIHKNNEELSQCRHLTTATLVLPSTDDWNGTILDGEAQRICLDCREVLEVVG